MTWRFSMAGRGPSGATEPQLDRALRIRRKDIQIFCDFTAENTEAYLRLDLVLCPARLLGLMLRQGPALLRVYREQKPKKGGVTI